MAVCYKLASMAETSSDLPPLVFGNHQAVLDQDARLMTDRIQKVMPWSVAYEPVGNPKAFKHRSSSVTINGTKIIASSSSAVSIDVQDAAAASLLIPFVGQCTTVFQGENVPWRAGLDACFIPDAGRGGVGEERSVLMVEIDTERLTDTLQTMFGPLRSGLPDWQRAQSLKLQQGQISFLDMYQHVGGLINQLMQSQRLLDISGIDDTLYRLTAMMFCPDRMHNDLRTGLVANSTLDRLCQYMRAYLDEPLTLTELEQESGLSARALQYQFARKFGCSPMRWLLNQRLDVARQRLANPAAGETVTSVALSLCFANLGMFAARYRERFGELPSETLSRSSSRH